MSDKPFGLNEYATAGMPSKWAAIAYVIAGVAITVLTYITISAMPSLDLDISSSFFSDAERFGLYKTDFSGFVRRVIIWLILIFYVLVTWHGLKAYSKQKPSFGWPWHKWGFLGATALAGPVLIVNIILKGNWGRSRPRHLEIFGETQEFSQFWVYADQCRDNCSFASGEASGVAMIFISLSMLLEKRLRLVVLYVGTVATAMTAWLRVSIGAHFASDTIVGTAIMLIVAGLVYFVFFVGKAEWISKLDAKQQEKLAAKKGTG